MTEDRFLDALAGREGVVYAEPPRIDQPTGPYGITVAALAADRARPCTVADLKALSVAEAREVARRTLRLDAVTYGFDKLTDEHLRMQLLDFGYNSSPARAVRWLQRAIGMPKAFVTGKIDDRTLHALAGASGVIVNNALVAGRVRMLDDATDGGEVDKRFEEGLESRALAFGLFDH